MKAHEAAIRGLIRRHVERIGCERYRITRDGEVHIYGEMPGSIETGWWLFAQSVSEARDIIQQESAA